MKAITREWIARAEDDLLAAQLLLAQPELTNVVAFHPQQVVEKCLKAALEESGNAAPKTHSLTRLQSLIESHVSVVVERDMLDRLEAIYIAARYPGEMGLLPAGKPTQAEAEELYRFAQGFLEQIRTVLARKAANDLPE